MRPRLLAHRGWTSLFSFLAPASRFFLLPSLPVPPPSSPATTRAKKREAKRVQVPGMEGLLLHSGSRTRLPVPPSPYFLLAVVISHPGSLFSYITLRWILERTVQEGPHYSSLHGHSWKHISNDSLTPFYPLSPSFLFASPRARFPERWLRSCFTFTRARGPAFRGGFGWIAVARRVNIWNPLVCGMIERRFYASPLLG